MNNAEYVEQAKQMLADKKYEELLKWIEFPPCACVGIQNNEPACPCRMKQAAAQKITGVAILKTKIAEEKS